MGILNFKEQLTEFINDEYHRLVGFTDNLAAFDDEHSAEDLVQDVMLNLFERADIKLPVENLSAYVYRSIRNKVIDYFRKRKNKHVSLDQPIRNHENLTLIDIISKTGKRKSTEGRHKIASTLFGILNQLSDEERAIVIATELDHHSFVDLSKKSGVPVNTLRSKKHRALQKVKHKFENDPNRLDNL